MDFRNKTVVITGASSGIGEALARDFGRCGANVVIGARNGQKLSELAAQIEANQTTRNDVRSELSGAENEVQSQQNQTTQSGAKSEPHHTAWVATDVTKEEDCKRLIDLAVERFGGVDVLICNAGISMRALLDDVEVAVLQRLMDVNFWGTVYCVKHALPWLQRSWGTIVGVSSVAGIHGLPGRTGYSASKFAMTGFLETVRIENLHKGVHVMIACPGFTASNVRLSALTANGTAQGETPRDEGSMMSAEEVAVRIIKGVARRRRFLTMEFQGRATRFLKKFAPALLDRLFFNHMAKEPDSPLKVLRE